MTAPFDAVARPRHYNTHPSGVECINVAKWHSFAVGSAFKYLWRAGKKGPAIQDLQKAAQYIAFEIARLQQVEDGRRYLRKVRAAGGNDEKPPHHCSDCPDHPWGPAEGWQEDPRCMAAPHECPHAEVNP